MPALTIRAGPGTSGQLRTSPQRELVGSAAASKRYSAVNAMLLNEFLKEHRKVEEQQAAIKQLESRVGQYEDLRSTVAQQEKQIQFLIASVEAQVSQIQKVSAQLAAASPSNGGLEVSNRALRLVNNH